MTPRRLALATLFLAGLLVLAGCGKQAELARPRPMFGTPSQPTAEGITRDAMARRALADAAPHADPRAPESLDEQRQVRVKRNAKGAAVATFAPVDPSAPHPPGSPEDLPSSDLPAASSDAPPQ